ncbi:MAG: hypothetical protein O7G87_15580, partial [bacterium]|nr:hypothetical protein [bacterium]
MHLGVVGMLPGDFRTFEPEHLQSVQAEGFGGVGFHLPGDRVPEITPTDTQSCRDLFSDHNLSLVQFSISYPECLFHPQADICQEIISKITAGAEIAAGLGAHYFLIRPGSLNPEGSWTPHRDNFTS